MASPRNQALADWMTEHALTAAEFATRLNAQLTALTGRPGTATDRTVRRWLCGEVTWPQTGQREALTRLTGLPLQDLGFTPGTPPRQRPGPRPSVRTPRRPAAHLPSSAGPRPGWASVTSPGSPRS